MPEVPYLPFKDVVIKYKPLNKSRHDQAPLEEGETLEEGEEEPNTFMGGIRMMTLQEVEVRTRAVMQKVCFNPSVTNGFN